MIVQTSMYLPITHLRQLLTHDEILFSSHPATHLSSNFETNTKHHVSLPINISYMSRTQAPLFKLKKLFWSCWVFIAAHGLSLVAVKRDPSSPRCVGSRARGLQELQRERSAVVVYGLSCPLPRGIFLDPGLNPCLLHWQMHF